MRASTGRWSGRLARMRRPGRRPVLRRSSNGPPRHGVRAADSQRGLVPRLFSTARSVLTRAKARPSTMVGGLRAAAQAGSQFGNVLPLPGAAPGGARPLNDSALIKARAIVLRPPSNIEPGPAGRDRISPPDDSMNYDCGTMGEEAVGRASPVVRASRPDGAVRKGYENPGRFVSAA